MELKYAYIQNENSIAYFFSNMGRFALDFLSSFMRYYYTSHDVKLAMDFGFLDRVAQAISGVRIRSDNGTQFLKKLMKLNFSSSNIAQEKIYLVSTKADPHLEPHNPILLKDVIRRFKFSYFKGASNTINLFINLYTSERMHSVISIHYQWRNMNYGKNI